MTLLERYKAAMLPSPRAYGRRTGKTTRVADLLIQELFNNIGEWVPIIDPDSERGNNYLPDVYLRDLISRRLVSEHYVFITPNTKANKGLHLEIVPVRESEVYAKMKPSPYTDERLALVGTSNANLRIVWLMKLTEKR